MLPSLCSPPPPLCVHVCAGCGKQCIKIDIYDLTKELGSFKVQDYVLL